MICALALLAACEDPGAGNNYVEELVVYGRISAGSARPDTVFVSRTSPLDQPFEYDDRWVSAALVTLSGGGQNVTLHPVAGRPGRYIDQGTQPLTIEPGTSYTLTVEFEGDRLTASATVPDSLAIASIGSTAFICGNAIDTVVAINLYLEENHPGAVESAFRLRHWTGLSMDTVLYREGPCYSASFLSTPLFIIHWVGDGSGGLLRAYSQAVDPSFERAIIDSSFAAHAFKGHMARDEEGNLYRSPSVTFNASSTDLRFSWLFFNYTGPHIISMELTDENLPAYLEGDPLGMNPLIEPQGNIVGGKGLFYASVVKRFPVWVTRQTP